MKLLVRRWVSGALAGVASMFTLCVFATPELPLRVSLAPILGEHAPASEGWTTYLARIENATDTERRGTVYLTPARGMYREPQTDDAFSEAPIWIAPRGQLSLELLAVGGLGGAVEAVVLDRERRPLGSGQAFTSSPNLPHLFDLARDGSLPNWLDGKPLPMAAPTPDPLLPGGGVSVEPPLVRVTRAHWRTESRAPVLPLRASGYSAATLVLTKSDHVLALAPTARAALAQWVVSGGALALVVDRDGDLSSPVLVDWLGATAQRSDAPEALLDAQPLRVSPAGGDPSAAVESSVITVEPDAAMRVLLSGFTGGNLHPSPWGAVASYGLGEITLLGFDPHSAPFADARWTEAKLLTLLAHAWDRRSAVAVPHAARDPRDFRSHSAERYLRHLRHQHWAISGAALLLIAYAVIAGPVNFQRARAKGRPLSALLGLLLGSIVALISVLAIGAFSRGANHRARHLTLIDAGAGMTHGAAVRFRSFFAADYRGLELRASAGGGVLGLVQADGGLHARLLLDASGPVLTELRGKPWQTLNVREDGFATLGGGLSLTRDRDGTLRLKNRVGRDLAAVLARDESGRMVFFRRIPDGASPAFGEGDPVAYSELRSTVGTTPLLLHQLGELLDETAPGLAGAWGAFEDLSSGETDWWPRDVPVVMAQIVGGEARLDDTGFTLESDRVLLRVVGWGGDP